MSFPELFGLKGIDEGSGLETGKELNCNHDFNR